MRVLALAWKEYAEEQEKLTVDEIKTGFNFAGLQGMLDPPRPEAIEAIKGCKRAGAKVVMITGDHGVTALAIARELGIADQSSRVLTGSELEIMSDDELFSLVEMWQYLPEFHPSINCALPSSWSARERSLP